METPLQPLFQAIAQAQDEAELRGAMMATLGAYNADNLADLSALCLHLSTRLAELRSKPVSEFTGSHATASVENRLTPREMQIAELVAQGLTNAQIGASLWITEHTVKQALKRMFRKLGISSRAELVARIAKSSHKLAAS